MNNNLDRLAREVSNEISLLIEPSGILFRIFSRAKTDESISKKMISKNYKKIEKNMQDIIGIRITLYFNDDIEIVYKILKNHPRYLDETKDESDDISFKPQRLNLIFKLKPSHCEELMDKYSTYYNGNIDTTFEIQIRTVFSEGWHEVEHDLRYKNKDDWKGNIDMSRVMNGIYATLETQDWTILSIFDKLAYRHYKNKNWEAMLRSKMRIRFLNQQLSKELYQILDSENNLAKEVFRIDRKDFLKKIINDKIKIPLTMDNVLHILNIYFLKNEKILEYTPEAIKTKKEILKYLD